MFAKLDVFKTAHAMAVHAGHRQALVAQNVANADTPGYRARDVVPFAQIHQSDSLETAMLATRGQHLNGMAAGARPIPVFQREAQADPNGNSVEIAQELMLGVEAKRQHDRAIAIYKSAMSVLRTSLGRP